MPAEGIVGPQSALVEGLLKSLCYSSQEEGAEECFCSYRPLPSQGVWERGKEVWHSPDVGPSLLSSQALWTGLATCSGLGRQASSQAGAPTGVSICVAGSCSGYFYQPN